MSDPSLPARTEGRGPARSAERPASDIVGGDYNLDTLTDKISSIVLNRPVTWRWVAAFATAFAFSVVLFVSLAVIVTYGVGVWGINVPVAWGFAIVNFVWWVGIGHAGTLISAILLLLHQEWRTSINRFAEAMTLFAVACAGIFPLIHMGRPWFFYWLMPYPNTMALWPNFNSPLVWDVFAISTYFTVSLLFWYVGLIPDLATLRDRSKTFVPRVIYGVLAMGWRGSAHHWKRYETAYLLLAGLATPLVVSVHTVVSFDFAVTILPGWHATVFPPYFVAGAILSGFAMVLTLSIPLRAIYGLKDFITLRHLDNMAMICLATSLMVGYGYLMELFMGWYSGNTFEMYVFLKSRPFGVYGLAYWFLILCNILIPQLLWFPAVRANTKLLWGVSIVINIGMWLERFVIVMSLNQDFLPSSWGRYSPTFWDWSTYVGTIGFFFTLMILFLRFLPVISIFEMRTLVVEDTAPGETGGRE